MRDSWMAAARAACSLAVFALLLAPLAASAQEREERVDRLFASFARAGVPGAAVGVIQDGQLVLAKGYGLADLEADAAVTPTTNFRLASLTKQYTAMAAMILIDRGQLRLEDKITDHIREFPAYGARITIKQLLQHTSGLRDYEDLIPSDQETQVSDDDVVRLLGTVSGTDFTPGSRYRYCNGGYVLLGVIVGRVAGKRFSEFLRDEIFQPLGMTNTVAYENGRNDVPERAFGHSRGGSGFERTDQSVTSATLGDGGVYTSVTDWLAWDAALYTEQLVSASLMQQAFTPGRLPDGSSTGYGFGWTIGTFRGERKVAHTGSTIGFRTAVARFPEHRLTVVVLVNRAEASPWDMADQIAGIYW